MTEGTDNLFAELPDILTVQEVADLLRMNKAAIYKWLRAGTIPAYYRSRSWFIVRDELKEWMRLGSNQGGRAPNLGGADEDDEKNDGSGANDTQTK